MAAFLEFGITQTTVKWLFFTCLVIILTVTDLRVRMLPDVVNWPGFAAGLLFSAFVPPDRRVCAIPWLPVVSTQIPGICGGDSGWIAGRGVWELSACGGWRRRTKWLRGREGMGMGDVKMMAMVGAFLGLRGTFLTLLAGSLLGSVIGISVVLALYLGGWRSGLAKRAQPAGTGDGARIAVGDCEPVSVAAGDVFGDWGAGDCVCDAGDGGTVADLQRDRWLKMEKLTQRTRENRDGKPDNAETRRIAELRRGRERRGERRN